MSAYQPIIVIGAPRSGTKMLRDFVGAHPDVDTVPYDVNYIWRMGNESIPHDEFSAEQASEAICRKITRQIERFRRGNRCIIEKTVSNCLRVEFVTAVFPDAKFLHLVRDGRDVIESIQRQWKAPPDWRYILQKVRTFPIFDAFGYGARYARGLLQRTGQRNSKSAEVWGPRYKGIDQDLATRTLLCVCAIQWARCVRMASDSLQRYTPDQVLQVRYEDLVAAPIEYAHRIADFIGISPGPIEQQAGRVSTANVGKGRTALDPAAWQELQPILEAELREYGYVEFESANPAVPDNG